MVASQGYENSLNAFAYGYARLVLKNQEKRIFSPIPGVLIFFLMFIIAMLLWKLGKKRYGNDSVKIDNFLTRRNESIMISKEISPGSLNCTKKDLPKSIWIARDKHIVEFGESCSNIFFLLKKKDVNVFSYDVLDATAGMNIWIFVEGNRKSKQIKKLERIGKVILFSPEYIQNCGSSLLVLGIIPRFLSLISRNGYMNIDHVYEGIPDICTISYTFPTDVHKSLASILKHQKHFCVNHNESYLHITNCKDHASSHMGTARYVKANTEPFFISFNKFLLFPILRIATIIIIPTTPITMYTVPSPDSAD